MKQLSALAAAALFLGVLPLVFAADPAIALLGKLGIGILTLGFAAAAITYLVRLSDETLAIRNEDLHWY